MKHFPISSLQGIVKDYHRRIIADDKLADGSNIYFDKMKIKRRWGYTALGSNLPLLNPLTALYYYVQIRTTFAALIATTTRDTYKFNETTKAWQFITQKHITGQASCAGSTAVAGVTSSWVASWPDGYWQIKFGTQDINGTGTPNTWYTIASFVDPTHLELTSNGPNTGEDVNYVIRKCWTGLETDIHSITAAILPSTNEKILVLTNGVDNIQKWTGTNECVDLGGTPNKAKYLEYYYNKLILGWVIDTGVNYPQTIECSATGNPENWTSGGWAMYDLIDTSDEIVGIRTLSGRLVVYKSQSIAIMQATGNAANPLQYTENIIKNMSAVSINTVADMGRYHIFMGWNDIYMFDGINIQAIGEGMSKTIFSNINDDYIGKSFACVFWLKNLYCLFVPSKSSNYCDLCYAYDWGKKTWSLWNLNSALTSQSMGYTDLSKNWNDSHVELGSYATGTVTTSGSGYRTVTLTGGTWDIAWPGAAIKFSTTDHEGAGEWYEIASINSATTATLAEDCTLKSGVTYILGRGYLWTELGGDWLSVLVSANTEYVMIGDSSNYVHVFNDASIDDNGTNINAFIETKDYPLNDPKHTFRLLECIVNTVSGLAGETIRIKASIDFGAIWSDWINIDLLGNSDFVEHVTNFIQTGKQVRFKIENLSGVYFEIESMLVGFEDAGITVGR